MTVGPLSVHVCKVCIWVRLFGYGVAVRRSSAFPPLFSERAGLRKVYGRRIGLAVELFSPSPFD